MNKLPNQHSNSMIKHISCLAIGLAMAFTCRQSLAQSVATPPKVSPKVAALRAELNIIKAEFESRSEMILSVQDQLIVFEDDLSALRERKSKLAISEQSYPEILKTLHSQRVQLSIDLAGIDARYDAIAIAIKVETEKHNVDVVMPFKRLIELREAKLKALNESDKATAQQKQAAEIELLQAKVQLAQATKLSSSLTHLNSQLLDTSLERAEKTARLEKANSLFKETDEYRDYAAAISKNSTQALKSRNQLSLLLRRQAAAERQLEATKKELAELEN